MSVEGARKEDVQIGDEMPDGTILAGYYEGKPLYTTPRDAPGTYTFNEAAKYAKNLDAHGRHDFRAPSKDELNVLFQNRAAIGGFGTSGSYLFSSRYWSSSEEKSYAWEKCFGRSGQEDLTRTYAPSSLRCVR